MPLPTPLPSCLTALSHTTHSTHDAFLGKNDVWDDTLISDDDADMAEVTAMGAGKIHAMCILLRKTENLLKLLLLTFF